MDYLCYFWSHFRTLINIPEMTNFLSCTINLYHKNRLGYHFVIIYLFLCLFIYSFIYFYYMCMSVCLHIKACMPHAWSTLGDQKGAYVSWQELADSYEHNVDAGSWTQVLWTNKCSFWSISLGPSILFKITMNAL